MVLIHSDNAKKLWTLKIYSIWISFKNMNINFFVSFQPIGFSFLFSVQNLPDHHKWFTGIENEFNVLSKQKVWTLNTSKCSKLQFIVTWKIFVYSKYLCVTWFICNSSLIAHVFNTSAINYEHRVYTLQCRTCFELQCVCHIIIF